MSKRVAVLFLLLAFFGILTTADQDFEGFDEEKEEIEKDLPPVNVQLGLETVKETEETENKQKEEEKDVPTVHATMHWDSDEFEGFETSPKEDAKQTEQRPPLKSGERKKRSIFEKQDSYTKEIIGIVLLAIYLLNVFIGKTQNESLAVSWAKEFASEDAVLDKNFALIGPGDEMDGEILMKESHSCFKFYASGRRYTQALLATLNLRCRQDLMSVLSYTVIPKKDSIDIEVFLNESDMLPMVCVLASPKLVKTLLRENDDIKIYAREIPVKQIPKWPLDLINVWTESPDVFYDLMVPEVKSILLSSEFPGVYGKYFRYIHITSDSAAGTHKKVIKFSFNLPSSSRMYELERLMSLIPLLIDAVAEYSPSQEAKKRAERQRALESERIWKEGAEERKEALQQKKAEEQLAEMERIRRLPPEEQQKWMEKQQKIKQRRSTKVKMIRG